VVVAHPGTRLSREQIQDELKDRVARYKIPQKILFVDEIPKTPGLKVDKKHIRTMFGG
jgi:fatty-acyl-CoA synthase/long-chain acyl-CoA synthetase